MMLLLQRESIDSLVAGDELLQGSWKLSVIVMFGAGLGLLLERLAYQLKFLRLDLRPSVAKLQFEKAVPAFTRKNFSETVVQ